MRILALDLGKSTGWASWDGTRRESGVQKFDVKRGESVGMRFVRFNRWLEEMACLEEGGKKIDFIFYEKPWGKMPTGAAAEISLGFATRIQEFAARHGIEHDGSTNATTLKKWVTGGGKAKKPEVIAAVKERFFPGGDAKKINDDEADAVALLEYVRAEILPRTGGV